MSSRNKTTTHPETMTLKYGYMWVEETEEIRTATGKTTRTTKHIARDPQVGFFRKLLRV
jgi:hypothetical protein